MLQIIKASLQKPISVMVMVAGVIFFSVLAIFRIPVDILPSLDLPTIYIVQPYGGMAPEEMDAFMATKYQDHFLYVSGIRNVEVKTIQGLSLLKLQFYPGTDMAQAAAEVANNVSRAKAYMPEGTVPPQVIRFDASSVPIGQLVFSSTGRSLNEIQDLANSRVRPMFGKIPGVSSPPPFGGNQRTIVIKVDPGLVRSYGLTPEEIIKALIEGNQPSPAGNIRIGNKTFMTPVNSLIRNPADFLNLPIRTGDRTPIFVRDIATVEDGSDITVSYALVNGRRAVYIPVVKKADASTLDVVNNIQSSLDDLRSVLPEDVKISYEFDQSGYVMNSLKNLLIEGGLGAILTGLMVLLFLRDIRSVLIVIITIPISILSAVILLSLFGQTINIMTLSGLALSIGILVDQATVSIENIHQHLESGKARSRAIWDACKEMIFPEFLILLCVLAVFAPSIIMTGIPRAMFLPLSLSVAFAMIPSFLLSQTLVPVLANWLLRPKEHTLTPVSSKANLYERATQSEKSYLEKNMNLFEKLKRWYGNTINKVVKNIRSVTVVYFAVTSIIVICGFLYIGRDILPESNGRQFQVRLRAEDGTRVERTEALLLKILRVIESIVGPENIGISSAYVGTVPSSYGTSNIFVFNSGPHEAVMQLALRKDYKVDLDKLKEKIREAVRQNMPEVKISFEPMELIDKIMSQGSSNPIEVSIGSKDIQVSAQFAKKIEIEMKSISQLRDVQIAQPMKYPIINIKINRERAAQLGLTSTQVSKSIVAATSSSRFTQKNLWLDYGKGLAYQVQVQIPAHKMTSVEDLGNIPLVSGQMHPVLSDIASFSEESAAGQYDRSGPFRLVTVTANFEGTDLGTAAGLVREAIAKAGEPPRGTVVELNGQPQLLDETLSSLQTGLLIAVVIIFLLLTASFQSVRLALLILSVVPAVVAGSLIMLVLCGATLNLQSYMGLIMSVGVSVANSILMITKAETNRHTMRTAAEAATMAANSRLRPILMTSIAMITGMLPMALGLGEGGDQVSPLGQAVIGGLIASTIASLLILPGLFSSIQKNVSTKSVSLDPEDVYSKYYSPAKID